MPREQRRRFTIFDVERAKQFIAAISGHKYEVLFALAMTTGMRPSEYLALTSSDFDLERGTVSISKTLEWRKGGWRFEDTKRERSRRLVKLQNWVVTLLRKFYEAASASEAGHGDLVFTSDRRGPIQESKFVGRHFKPLLRSAGLPNIRLYDLRHTAATLGLVAGVSPKIVSEQLGHASVAFTLEASSHVLPHMQDTAAMKVEALLMAALSGCEPCGHERGAQVLHPRSEHKQSVLVTENGNIGLKLASPSAWPAYCTHILCRAAVEV